MRQTLVAALDFGVRRKVLAYNPAAMAELTPTAAASRSPPCPHPRRSPQAVGCVGGRAARQPRSSDAHSRDYDPGEALGLCWDAVDLDAGAITVRRAVRLRRRQGTTRRRSQERRQLSHHRPSDAGDRSLARPAPRSSPSSSWRPAPGPSRIPDWCSRPQRHSVEPGQRPPRAGAICIAAGIDPVRPHELRHTAASVLSDQGVPLEHIADLLGHVDVTMVSRTYRHRLRPSVDAAVNVMDRVFGG